MKRGPLIKVAGDSVGRASVPKSSDVSGDLVLDACGCYPYPYCRDVIVDASGATGKSSAQSASFTNVRDNLAWIVPTSGVANNSQHVGVTIESQLCCVNFPWTLGVMYRFDGNVFVDGGIVPTYTITAMTLGNAYKVKFNAATFSVSFYENDTFLLNHVLGTAGIYKFWNSPLADGVNLFNVNLIG